MTVSANALAWLVGIATAVTAVAFVVLLTFWVRDLKKGRLW